MADTTFVPRKVFDMAEQMTVTVSASRLIASKMIAPFQAIDKKLLPISASLANVGSIHLPIEVSYSNLGNFNCDF